MTAPRALPLLLTLALLLSQLAGQAHAVTHLDTSKEPLAHTTLCAKCASFDNLSSMLPPSATIGTAVRLSGEQTDLAEYGFDETTRTAFQSRAPPRLR
jgi:hypothetical protein